MRYLSVFLAVLVVPVLVLAQTEPDPGTLLAALITAVQGRHWVVVVGLVLTALTFLARRYGGTYVPWVQTDRGGAALAIAVAVLGTLGTVLAGGTFSVGTFFDALALAMTNAGGYVLLKKLLAPADAPAKPATPATGITLLPTLIALLFLSAVAVVLFTPRLTRAADESPFRWSIPVGSAVLVPAVAITPLAISLRDGKVTGGPTFGAGYELLWHPTEVTARGIAVYGSFRSTVDGMRPLVSVLGVFTPWFGLGIGYQFGGAAPFRDSAVGLVSIGVNLGFVVESQPAAAAKPNP